VFEHDPVRDATAVTAPRMCRVEFGSGIDAELRSELAPERLDETDWQRRHGFSG
jgi:hypothetical protein